LLRRLTRTKSFELVSWTLHQGHRAVYHNHTTANSVW